MKHLLMLLATCASISYPSLAQEVVNDATAPLHLMKPAYQYAYGVPAQSEVKNTMDRILQYLDQTTFAALDETGRQLKRGDYRLTSYEWGVTYSAMLRAGQLTADTRYTDYAMTRMRFLAQQAPKFKAWRDKGETIDPLMEQVVAPDALDDCGAICCAMIKSGDKGLQPQIDTYYDYIANKQYRYKDGQFARLRPVENTVWLDDMFMGIPALALAGNWQEAARQFELFHQKMWVAEKQLYRHGWTPGDVHPSFFWGRANGWALLTACELLDVKEDPTIMRCFKEHLDGLMALQGINGAWHQLLDRSETYEETSCTAIYCYCLAHAINRGWIEAEPYVGQTLLAWNYVNAHVNTKGQVEGTCVGTGLAFDPAFYAYRPVNNFAAHSYGPVLWAAAEVYHLIGTRCIKLNDSAVHFYPIDPQTDEPIFYVKPAPIINVIGDSYVANHRRPKEETWHYKMARQLGFTYNGYGRNGSCIAFDRTHDGKWNFGPAMWQRYRDMDPNADYVLIIAGHNDAEKVRDNKDSLQMFRDSLCVMIDGIRQLCPKARLGFVTPWNVDAPGFEAVGSVIRKVCKQYGIPLLWNLDRKCIIDPRSESFRAQYFQQKSDKAHLNAAGHDLFLTVAQPWFEKEMMKK